MDIEDVLANLVLDDYPKPTNSLGKVPRLPDLTATALF